MSHCYRLAGQDFCFPDAIPELEPFRISGGERGLELFSVPPPRSMIGRTLGWVGGENRQVQVWSAPPGVLLKVEGGSDFYIAPGGREIVRVADYQPVVSEVEPSAPQTLTDLDREILLGPAIVLALAQRGTWSLHASAAAFRGHTFAFVGETGEGKSTLAAYLSEAGGKWHRVADDILPVTAGSVGMEAWPRFPQLKLSPHVQPGVGLPERLPLDRICVLEPADKDQLPSLLLLPPNESVQVLLKHTAGTRLFDPRLLASHLDFCSRAARQVLVYRLIDPHRKDILPLIKLLLEKIC